MKQWNDRGLMVLGAGVLLGLAVLGFLIKSSVVSFKQYERTITVRGLAEQEHMADIVIWPIHFTEASNNLEEIYQSLEESAGKVIRFLESNGVSPDEISTSAPIVTDRLAQRYGSEQNSQFRYVASQTVTVYSGNVEETRQTMNNLVDLGKQGVTIAPEEYDNQTQYLFTRLNDIKPIMIEEATIEARKVAEKFAEDSDSQLGKIRTASQGQFSISDRDNNNPHIKNIRVVSTIVYYLND